MVARVMRRPSLNKACFDVNDPPGTAFAAQGNSTTLSSVNGVPKGSCVAAAMIVVVVATGCVRLISQLRARKAAMPPITIATTRAIMLLIRMATLPHFGAGAYGQSRVGMCRLGIITHQYKGALQTVILSRATNSR